jgi:protein transport protein SEC20
MRSTSSAHDTLLNVMDTSKQLVTALEKSDWLDRMLIIAGLVFFFLVVAFIIKQRVIDRSLRIALWWTRFVPDFSSDAALLHAEEGLAKTIATASSVVVSLSTTALVATTSPPLPSSSVEISSSLQVTQTVQTAIETALEPLLETSELDTTIISIPLTPTEIPDALHDHDEL